MDAYAPMLIECGLKGMIGKGLRMIDCRSHEEIWSPLLWCNRGAAALISSCIINQEIIAFEDLGTEAIRRIEVKDFPCFVVIDAQGRDIYKKETEISNSRMMII